MVSVLGLYLDNSVALLRDVMPPTPIWNERKKYYDPIIVTEELLAEWEKVPAEQVEVEPLTGNGLLIGEGSCYRLHIVRCKHQDGHYSIQPEWKLFPLNPQRHKLLRNTQLWYVDVKEDVAYTMELNERMKNSPNVMFRSHCYYSPINIVNLQMMLCRKHDITMWQAQQRSSGWTAEDWFEELDGKFDADLCWQHTD